MLNNLKKLANILDLKGMYKDADLIDDILFKLAQKGEHTQGLKDSYEQQDQAPKGDGTASNKPVKPGSQDGKSDSEYYDSEKDTGGGSGVKNNATQSPEEVMRDLNEIHGIEILDESLLEDISNELFVSEQAQEVGALSPSTRGEEQPFVPSPVLGDLFDKRFSLGVRVEFGKSLVEYYGKEFYVKSFGDVNGVPYALITGFRDEDRVFRAGDRFLNLGNVSEIDVKNKLFTVVADLPQVPDLDLTTPY